MKKKALHSKKKIRGESKEPIGKLQRRLWKYCKILTRLLHGNECYACGRKGLEGGNWHTSHLIPKGACGASLKYDLRNLRPCCYNCNINLGGNGAEFMRKMIIREGQEFVDKLFQDKNLVVKAHDHYLMLAERYKILIEDLH